MAKRTKRGQKTHDEGVLKWVKQLEKKGFDVMADLPGYEKPDKIKGRIPDVLAKEKNKTVLIGEVETPASLKADEQQQKLLKQGAKNLGAKFKMKIVKEHMGKK